jgi:hypothetical protein
MVAYGSVVSLGNHRVASSRVRFHNRWQHPTHLSHKSLQVHHTLRSRGSSVGIETGCGPNGWGSIPSRGNNCSLLHSVQTGSGAHPAYSMGTGASPRGQSRRGVKLTTHLRLVPRSRKRGFIHPLPHTPSWRSV